MNLSRDSILDYLRDHAGVDVTGIDEETPLFSSRLVDSFTLVDLIRHIETHSGFKMKATEVNLDNLDTIARILSFAEKRTNGAGPST